MKIDRIKVVGLFDRFDHSLEFKPNERIMIIYGPNGFGKTMILRLINALFNQPVRSLARIPFHEVVISFDDNSCLKVSRRIHQGQEGQQESHINLSLTFQDSDGKSDSFTPKSRISTKELGFPVGMIEDIIPVLDQVGAAEWRHRRTGEILALEDVLELFGDELPITETELAPNSPEWLGRIRNLIPVRFIDTERLTHPILRTSRQVRPRRFVGHEVNRSERTVRYYSEELGQLVRQTLTEYGSLSQSLDRTFPVRLVERPASPNLTMDGLQKELAEIDTKRSRLMEAGLLAQEQEGLVIPDLDKVDKSRLGVLAVYAQDAKKKLSVFDDLYAKVDTLKRIANSRFLHKGVVIGSDGLKVVTSDGLQLQPEMLSSGEQHELVILYDLLFRVPDNSLILIDEPELSLHVLWQEKFLDDLEEMAKLSRFQTILATHSPQIIGDRWHLTVELKGPNGE